jgi:hypothetical protein
MYLYCLPFTHQFLTLRSLGPHSTIADLHTFLSLSAPPTHIFSRCGRVKAFVSIVRNITYYDLENTGAFGAPNRVLRDTGTELFKTHKTGTVPEKIGTNGIPVLIANIT